MGMKNSRFTPLRKPKAPYLFRNSYNHILNPSFLSKLKEFATVNSKAIFQKTIAKIKLLP